MRSRTPWFILWLLACGCSGVATPTPAQSLPTPSPSGRGATASFGPATPSTAVPAPASSPTATATAATPEPSLAEPDGGLPDAASRPPGIAPEGMAWVPGGTFTMGADEGGEEDEHPAHAVTLAGFWLDFTEVSVSAYAECVAAGRCRPYREDAARSFKAGADARFRGPRQPVSAVSWDDAKNYCEFRAKRLPREAEWERAARGDDGRRFPWGSESPEPTKHGCFARGTGSPGGVTCDVVSFPDGKGPYGHLGLGGNVWEWLVDFYDPYAYRRPGASQGEPGSCPEILKTQNELRAAGRQGFTGTNPIPAQCEHVLRGGAFNYPGPGLRTSNRVHHPGTWRMLVAGLRCARDAETAKP